jgi:uncharacterized repeat protein (TIGR01451 family)
VTNEGNVTVNSLAINDTPASPAGPLASGPTCSVTVLAPGSSTACVATYVVARADISAGSINDTATAIDRIPNGTPNESEPSSATVAAVGRSALTVTKAAQPTTVHAVGQAVAYTFVVTNVGNIAVSSLAIVDVQHPPAGHLTATPVCAATQLVPDAVTTCTATYRVTQADLDHGSISDTATATATDQNGDSISSSPASATVRVQVRPSISIVTTTSLAFYTAAGTEVPYRFVVTNTGNVSLSAVRVAAYLPGLSVVTCPRTQLPSGTSMTCTATYFTTDHDLSVGRVRIVAIAIGRPPRGSHVASRPSGVVVPAMGVTTPVTG